MYIVIKLLLVKNCPTWSVWSRGEACPQSDLPASYRCRGFPGRLNTPESKKNVSRIHLFGELIWVLNFLVMEKINDLWHISLKYHFAWQSEFVRQKQKKDNKHFQTKLHFKPVGFEYKYTRPHHNFKAYSLNIEQLPRTREASVVGNWRRASNFCNPVRLPPCSSGSPPPEVVKNYKFWNTDK